MLLQPKNLESGRVAAEAPIEELNSLILLYLEHSSFKHKFCNTQRGESSFRLLHIATVFVTSNVSNFVLSLNFRISSLFEHGAMIEIT